MREIVLGILDGNVLEAKEALNQRLKNLVDEKLNQVKIRLVAEMYPEIDVELVEEQLDEANVTKMGRTKTVRVRIRGGKVQRRKKLSAIPGYTIRGGKMVRMSSQERRHRKMAARLSKFKRRAKLRQSLRKRKQSLRKRKAMGV